MRLVVVLEPFRYYYFYNYSVRLQIYHDRQPGYLLNMYYQTAILVTLFAITLKSSNPDNIFFSQSAEYCSCNLNLNLVTFLSLIKNVIIIENALRSCIRILTKPQGKRHVVNTFPSMKTKNVDSFLNYLYALSASLWRSRTRLPFLTHVRMHKSVHRKCTHTETSTLRMIHTDNL